MKKILLIFGANGALGSGVTKVLSSKDYGKIHLFDFKFADITDDGKTKKHIVKDLSVEENVKEAFANVKPDKNTVFFLFSTVGGFAGGKKIWESDVEEWNKMMQINLNTSYLLAKHFSLLVKNSHSGSLCFTAAYTGLYPEEGKAAYGTSKAALVHLVKTLAEEGKAINLSANAIAPYIIDTPANREWMKDANYDSWMKPDEIAELIQLLFSNYYFVTSNIIKLKHRFSIT
jgi:NAD(P)-dependent dehydrogenase (short-subunit alcohol dehydrogenase family)